MRRSTTSLALCLLAVALTTATVHAQEEASTWNINSDGVVVDGYDVVAYFSEDRPVRGSANFSAEFDGATFYFSSADNREMFTAEPEKYVPKFGGFCAFGMASHQAKVPVDPHTFKIYNGELLLFYNDLYEGEPVNTKIMWNQSEEELHDKAEESWTAIRAPAE